MMMKVGPSNFRLKASSTLFWTIVFASSISLVLLNKELSFAPARITRCFGSGESLPVFTIYSNCSGLGNLVNASAYGSEMAASCFPPRMRLLGDGLYALKPHDQYVDYSGRSSAILKASTKHPQNMTNFEVVGLLSAIWSAYRSRHAALLYIGKPDHKCLAPHFTRIYGAMSAFHSGFELVLYSDLDAHFNSKFTGDWKVQDFIPNRAFFAIQEEKNICSGAWIARRRAGRKFLEKWREQGKSVCCLHHTYDQVSFKHTVLAYITGNTTKSFAEKYGICKDAPTPLYGPETDRVINGIYFHNNITRQLHNCGNRWGGCINRHDPSLLNHYGNDAILKKQFRYMSEALTNAEMAKNIALRNLF